MEHLWQYWFKRRKNEEDTRPNEEINKWRNKYEVYNNNNNNKKQKQKLNFLCTFINCIDIYIPSRKKEEKTKNRLICYVSDLHTCSFLTHTLTYLQYVCRSIYVYLYLLISLRLYLTLWFSLSLCLIFSPSRLLDKSKWKKTKQAKESVGSKIERNIMKRSK